MPKTIGGKIAFNAMEKEEIKKLKKEGKFAGWENRKVSGVRCEERGTIGTLFGPGLFDTVRIAERMNVRNEKIRSNRN